MASLIRILTPAFFAAAVLAHGADQSTKLVGKWRAKSVSVPVSGPTAEKARAMMMTSTLNLSRDKTFTMILVDPMKGTWKVTGHNLALTITEMLGRKMTDILAMVRSNYENDPSPRHKAALEELSKPMIFAISADSKTLTLKQAPGKAGLVLMR